MKIAQAANIVPYLFILRVCADFNVDVMNIAKAIYIVPYLIALGFCSDVEEISTCFPRFGCINFTSEWFHATYRPTNVKPLDRHIINTKFLLLTQSSKKSLIIYDPISASAAHVNATKYNTLNTVMMFIHDFTSNGYTGWIKHMAAELFSLDKYNIITVDWQEGAEPPYIQAISNARVVAKEIELLLKILQDEFGLMVTEMHIIGHGVGAHIAGYVGKIVGNIGRITGLDPTGPYFEGMPACVKLTDQDAFYVEILHTDGKGKYHQGTLEPLGNIDFYFNNGSYQPGCIESRDYSSIVSLTRNELKEGEILPGCSHKRAFRYYLEAIQNSSCQFVGFHWDKISSYEKMGCINSKTSEVYCATIGLNIDVEMLSKQVNTRFEVKTESCKPYCLNDYYIVMKYAKCDEAEQEGTGYFDLMITEELTYTAANITFNSDPGTAVPIVLGNTSTFVEYSPTAMDVIEKIGLRWHFTTPFCFRCRNATCVEHLSVTHIKSWEGPGELPITNHFCPRNGEYVVVYDGAWCDEFKKCRQKQNPNNTHGACET